MCKLKLFTRNRFHLFYFAQSKGDDGQLSWSWSVMIDALNQMYDDWEEWTANQVEATFGMPLISHLIVLI